MVFSSFRTSTDFLIPSIHSAPPFFTQQPNARTQTMFTSQWSRLILSFAQHHRLFTLRVDEAMTEGRGNVWDAIFRNTRINRKLRPAYLEYLIAAMVEAGDAVYDPPKQRSSVLLYWRRPEEWAELLHDWASSTGQLNTIFTLLDITDPPLKSELSDIPLPLLHKAIGILEKTKRAQTITAGEGEGVRFLAGNSIR